MKVIHVETGMHLYGGALQVFFLLRGLRAYPGEHMLVCPPGSAIGKAAREFVRVVEIPCRGDHDLSFLRRLQRLLRRERPDLVHLHSRRGADTLGGIAAKLAGVPAILSRRVDNPEPRWWARLKYRLYDRVVTISEGIREVLLSEGVAPERIICVPSAVDTERYRPGEAVAERAWFRREFELAEGTRTVAMIAQLIPRKGHRTLLKAAPAILAAHPDTRFLLFGRGPEQEKLRELVSVAGLEEHVRFAGFRDDLPRVLPWIDVVAHPASMEGLGVALLQAAACGVPIVAGRAGGIPEIVRHGENGFLLTPGDSAALADYIKRLLGEPELRARFGAAGRRLTLEQFSVGAMVSGNQQIYAELCSSRRPAAGG